MLKTIGIALRDRHLQSPDQTVEDLLADHLPANADPRLRQVTVKQLLMTSGLAGDDSSLGGDDRISDRMAQSRDWVGHILSRRLEATPGAEFDYSSASSHLLSRRPLGHHPGGPGRLRSGLHPAAE